MAQSPDDWKDFLVLFQGHSTRGCAVIAVHFQLILTQGDTLSPPPFVGVSESSHGPLVSAVARSCGRGPSAAMAGGMGIETTCS